MGRKNLSWILVKPYADSLVNDEFVIRTFSESIDPIELMWHRDDETRLVEAIGKTDWQIQLEDQLPLSLDQPILIKRHEWHRAIKGTGDLTVKIKKIKDEL